MFSEELRQSAPLVQWLIHRLPRRESFGAGNIWNQRKPKKRRDHKLEGMESH